MKAMIVLAHPAEGSFNHAIAESVKGSLREKGHVVLYHDLYREKFNPVLPAAEIPKDGPIDPMVIEHCDELRTSGGIVIIHPNWWGQPPAILKGWIDRVVRPGVAYEFQEGDSGEGVPAGLLEGKTALVFNTSNTPEEREHAVFGDPLEILWKKCVFDFCGVKRFARKTFSIVVTSTPEQRTEWLNEAERLVKEYFP
jgi:putative NADPH-quinone reductase